MAVHLPGNASKHSEARSGRDDGGDDARPWRCFLAWLPPESVLDALVAIAAGLAPALPHRRLRWLPRESLHLTLRFLGDSDEVARDRVTALLAAMPALPSIPARVAGIQYLPSSRDARVLVLRVESEGMLEQFAAVLEAGVRELGFAPEPRAFRAHITIARVRPGNERLAALTVPPPSVALAIDHVALMRSRLGGGPARYQALLRRELARG